MSELARVVPRHGWTEEQLLRAATVLAQLHGWNPDEQLGKQLRQSDPRWSTAQYIHGKAGTARWSCRNDIIAAVDLLDRAKADPSFGLPKRREQRCGGEEDVS